MRRLRDSVLALATIAVMAGCTVPPAPVEPHPEQVVDWPTAIAVPRQTGGSLRFAVVEPSEIVPSEAANPSAVLVVDALFDSLTRRGRTLLPEPAAAVAWETPDGGSTWVFDLRPEGTFHDGSPVTADDVRFAWELVARSPSTAHHLRLVEGFDAVRDGAAPSLAGLSAPDPLTFRVELTRPHADFPSIVAHPALAPVPRHLWQEDEAAFRLHPVGNGPFRSAEPWARGRFVRLTRFDEWANADQAASLDEVIFQSFDPDTAYLAYQQGRVDVSPVPEGALAQARAAHGSSADGYTGPGVLDGIAASVYFLGFGLGHPPFDDVEVRRAVSLAIDRDALARDLLEGNVTPARSLVPPVLPGARRSACPFCEHDPAEARATFEERGIDHLTIWISRGGGHDEIARRIRNDLAVAGVRVTIRRENFPEYLALLESGGAGFFRFGWIIEHPVLDDLLYPVVHSGGERNYGRYSNPEVDRLLDLARDTMDRGERTFRYQQAEGLALGSDQALLPLFFFRHRTVVAERVQGFRMDPLGGVDLARVVVPEEAGADSAEDG